TIIKLVHEFESGKISRRQLIQNLIVAASSAVGVAAAAENTGIRAIDLNHFLYQVTDYKRSRDFYSDLFGMKVSQDDGSRQCRLSVGETMMVVRSVPASAPRVDHISFTIADWDTNKSVQDSVVAELKRRGLDPHDNTRGWDIKDPDGFLIQIGGSKQ